MDPLTESSESALSEAVVIWTGWGRTSTPERDDQLVIETYGADVAVDLLPKLNKLEDDFYASDAKSFAAGLVEMGEAASADFRAKHPEISENAVKALAWCYMFDYK